MSESINSPNTAGKFRRQLLTTTSALALLAAVCVTSDAIAADEDSDRPTVWIGLGGQLEQMNDTEEFFTPSFILAAPRPAVQTISPFNVERPPQFSNGAEGNISFEPGGSDWIFSASARFGRSNGDKHARQQTLLPLHNITYHSVVVYVVKPLAAQFVDIRAQHDESHAILDFQAGKDVGLGIFGDKGTSTFNLGVRFAQFSAKSNVTLGSDPDFHIIYRSSFLRLPKSEPYHSNAASLTAARSFHGIGPSLSWNASAPFVGNQNGGELTFDWSVNAALLFGRQKAKTHHQTTGRFHTGTEYAHNNHTQPFRPITYQGPATPDHARVRTVTVPNVGGFAGITFRRSIAKVSFGYRADLFFGAMDGGIDTEKKENVGFYGPFATISIGIGG